MNADQPKNHRLHRIMLALAAVAACLAVLASPVIADDDDDDDDDRPAKQFGQSPIDITDDCIVTKGLPKLRFHYHSGDVIDEVCSEVSDGEVTVDGKEVVF